MIELFPYSTIIMIVIFELLSDVTGFKFTVDSDMSTCSTDKNRFVAFLSGLTDYFGNCVKESIKEDIKSRLHSDFLFSQTLIMFFFNQTDIVFMSPVLCLDGGVILFYIHSATSFSVNTAAVVVVEQLMSVNIFMKCVFSYFSKWTYNSLCSFVNLINVAIFYWLYFMDLDVFPDDVPILNPACKALIGWLFFQLGKRQSMSTTPDSDSI